MSEAVEEAIMRLEQELSLERRSRLAVEKVLREKTENFSVLAHEVRTPLMALLSIAELIAVTDLDGVQRGYISTLLHSAKGLMTVVEDLLHETSHGSSGLRVRPVPFDLGDFVTSFAAQAATEAGSCDLDFQLDYDLYGQMWVNGDAERIRQILQNFTSNALKFTKTGKITLRVGVVETTDDHAHLRFEVHDTGCGLSAEDKARVFEKYVQAGEIGNQTGLSFQPGNGLGLYIARQLAHMMDGEVGCASVESEGSVFWLTLCLPTAAVDSTIGDTSEAPVSAVAQTAKALHGHVLLVDDNPVNRKLLGAILNQLGVTFDEAASGEAALQSVLHCSYNAILMDLIMPGLDGSETAKSIRSLPTKNRDIPILKISSAPELEGEDQDDLGLFQGRSLRPTNAQGVYDLLARYLADEPVASRQAS